MGRSSLIRTEVARTGGRIEAVCMSGEAVILGEGFFRLP